MIKAIHFMTVLFLISNQGGAVDYEDCFKKTEPLLNELPVTSNPIHIDVATKDLQVVEIKVCFDNTKIYSIDTTWGSYIAQTGTLDEKTLVKSDIDAHGKASQDIPCDTIDV